MEQLYTYVHPITKKPAPMISEQTYNIIMKNADVSCSPNSSHFKSKMLSLCSVLTLPSSTTGTSTTPSLDSRLSSARTSSRSTGKVCHLPPLNLQVGVTFHVSSLSHLVVAERPQHMLMRVSVGIHMEDIDAAIEVGIPLTNYVIYCYT